MIPGDVDVVVVGGGTAGCVLAGRLSEDPSRTVLLVEEGPDPQPIPDVIADPKRQSEVIFATDYVRMYDVERPDGSTFPLLSGRVIGGGSSINNLGVVRPMRVDFDRWTRYGGDAWGYDALLPLLRDIETDPDFPDPALHGDRGPIRLRRPYRLGDTNDPAVKALLEATDDLGIPRCEDLNVPAPMGICASPYNVADGRRLSTAVAYLEPARHRPNLSILAETVVDRILVEDGRACGVVVRDGEGERTVHARAVVLAAGVFHSPQVLLRSGIGPAEDLRDHGIPVVADRPGVGGGYQDHAVVYLTFQGSAELREDYVIPKVRLIVPSDPARTIPDLHIFLQPSIRMEGMPPLLPVSIRLLEHRSTGRVRLASRDPEDLPVVQPALLEHPDDVEAILGGWRLVERLVAHPALASLYGPLVTPDPGSDPVEHIRSSYISYYHGVGTCRIGPADDLGAVVDPMLRVHGIDGLWVADASVLPTVPHANTNLAAIMVAEMAARAIARV